MNKEVVTILESFKENSKELQDVVVLAICSDNKIVIKTSDMPKANLSHLCQLFSAYVSSTFELKSDPKPNKNETTG